MQKFKIYKIEIGRTIPKALLSICLSFLLLTASQLAVLQTPTGSVMAVENTKATPVKHNLKTEKDINVAVEDILKQIERKVTEISNKLIDKKNTAQAEKELKKLQQELDKLNILALKDFENIEDNLIKQKASAKLLQRHRDVVALYEKEVKTLNDNIDEVIKAPSTKLKKKKISIAKGQFDRINKKTARMPADPNHNPHRALKPKPNNKPRINKKAFQTAGLFDTPHIKLASHGSYDLSKLPGAEDPAFLAETPEVQITQSIKDAAAALEHNPVEIYKWLYHKTEWVPTWGSIQSSEQTLLTRKGNAFALSSLMIALYRASGIPARYVHGTIDVPVDIFMNWMGGFTSPEGAHDLAANAGLFISSLISGGKIVGFRMEHIWVEAAIDFEPSRGANNKAADSWIRLDPSFKQYIPEYGYDMHSLLGFNGKEHITQYFNDPRDLTPYQFYSRRVLDYLNTQKPNWSLEGLYGHEKMAPIKDVVLNNISLLSNSLPYKVLVEGYTAHTIPDPLRTKVSLVLANNLSTGADVSYAISLPELGNKRLTLSYVPDSLPDNAEFSDYSNLFSQPAYLIYLRPQLRLDGVIVATGNSIGLGEGLNLVINIQSPSLLGQPIHNKLNAGAYSAIIIQGAESERTVTGKNMRQLGESIRSNTTSPEDLDYLLGQLLHENGKLWFFNLLYERDFYATTIGVRYTMLPSIAISTADVAVRYFFGLPKSVSIGYYNIDADLDAVAIGSIDGNQNRNIDFLYLSGMTGSAWEHLVNEGTFNETSISSIKVLKHAIKSTIPIHIIDQSNINTIYPLLKLDAEDLLDIQNMVNAGKFVIVPERNVVINNWRGAALIALEPNSGGGLYLISGGLSGGSTTVSSPEEWIKETYNLGRFEILLRSQIILWAKSLLLTPYGLGCKDPYDPKPVRVYTLGPAEDQWTCFKGIDSNGDPIPYAFAIDCSGLVAYAYSMVGFPFFEGLSAEGQHALVGSIGEIPTVPIIGDLRFWIGGPTWKPGKIGHVGITLNQNQWIAAQGNEVFAYSTIGLEFKDYGSVLKKHYVIP